MAANRIDEVYGILNGTTNYILSRMVRTGDGSLVNEIIEEGFTALKEDETK